MYTKIECKDLNFFELTSLSVKVFINRIIHIFIVIILFNLPVRIADFCISTYVFKPNSHPFISLGITIFENFLILVPTMLIIMIVNSELSNLEIKLSQLFKNSMYLWKGAIITSVIGNIITFLLLMLLIIPGIVWMVYYTFSVQVVTLRNLTGKDALNYSKFLVKGRWWKVFLIFLVYGLLYFIIFWFLKIPKNATENINELRLILIPIRELANTFIVVVTSVLYLNMQYIYETEDGIEKPTLIDYIMSKTGSEIDDSEVDFDYGQENVGIVCPGCGINLIEIDVICPVCGEVIVKED